MYSYSDAWNSMENLVGERITLLFGKELRHGTLKY
jgi:hypothetical protein